MALVGAALAAAGCSAGPRSGSVSPVVQWSLDVGFVPRVPPPVAGGRGDRRTTARSQEARATDREAGYRTRGGAVPLTARSVAAFALLYRRAAATFGVSWRLIASVHQQETAFSSAPGTYRGLNFAGCCAGPMQFNVTNGPVSTWERFSGAFRRASRPSRYPHRTRRHPSVYDDFDAIMASASLLAESGAGSDLDGAAWLASYDYYGHDATGLRYADAVLARAVGWARTGFCLRCTLDDGLVASFDAAFAAPIRAQLVADARAAAKHRKRHHKHTRHHRAHHRAPHRRRAHARHPGAGGPAPGPATPTPAAGTPNAAPAKPQPTAPAPAPPAPAPAAPAPAPVVPPAPAPATVAPAAPAPAPAPATVAPAAPAPAPVAP